MFVTVSANPMLEHLFHAPGFAVGRGHRPPTPALVAATAKPLNVARALKDLGEEVVAVVAAGGLTGEAIAARLTAEGLPFVLVPLAEESRSGAAIYDAGVVTSVYGPPPAMSDVELAAVVSAVTALLPAEALIVGGSTPRADLYPALCAAAGETPVVLDCWGESLTRSLGVVRPLLAKPNLQECRRTFGEVEAGREAGLAEGYADALRSLGVESSVITDGAGEALFTFGERRFRLRPPVVQTVHAVGCGDALCAGYLHARDRQPLDRAAFAMACGAHAASRPEVANLDREICEALVAEVGVE